MGAETVLDEPGPGRRSGLWLAEVVVVPKDGVNDPEGEAILGGLRSLGYSTVERVGAGRLFEVALAAPDADAAQAAVASMCQRLLANPVIESYRLRVRPLVAPESPIGARG